MTQRIVTIGNSPISAVSGRPLRTGEQAPAAIGRTGGFSRDTFDVINDTAGKVRVLNFVPSLSTGICDAQTRRFHQALAGNERVAVVTVSADLPFVQQNWCGAAGLDGAIMVSDHYDMAIAEAYGAHLLDLRLDQRAVIVVDESGVVRYTQYCPEISMHPDYEAALAAVDALL